MQITKSKLNEVAAEIKELMVEAIFDSAWTIIVMHHEIGRIITDELGEHITELLPTLSVKVGRSERTLYRSLQLYRKFPDKNSIPHGKGVSMNKLITTHLKAPNEPQEETCRYCPTHCPKHA